MTKKGRREALNLEPKRSVNSKLGWVRLSTDETVFHFQIWISDLSIHPSLLHVFSLISHKFQLLSDSKFITEVNSPPLLNFVVLGVIDFDSLSEYSYLEM